MHSVRGGAKVGLARSQRSNHRVDVDAPDAHYAIIDRHHREITPGNDLVNDRVTQVLRKVPQVLRNSYVS